MLFSVTPPHTSIFFFFNDTATTEIYTLSLHDALPISLPSGALDPDAPPEPGFVLPPVLWFPSPRSEEHTSELQSLTNLVCRLLLEKKNNNTWSLHPFGIRVHVDRDATPSEPDVSMVCR